MARFFSTAWIAVCCILASFSFTVTHAQTSSCTNLAQAQCTAANSGCEWDTYINGGTTAAPQHCFSSVADAISSLGAAYTGCGYWTTNFAGDQNACQSHGCQYLASTSQCVDFSSMYAQNASSTNTLYAGGTVSWVNPGYLGGQSPGGVYDTAITIAARIPWEHVANNPGKTRVFYVGSAVVDLASVPSACMSFYDRTFRPSDAAIQSPSTQASVDFDLAYWIDTYHSVQFNGNLADYQGNPITTFTGPSGVTGFVINNATLGTQNFDASNSARQALWNAFGPIEVNSRNTTLIKRVDRTGAGYMNVDYTMQFNMADVAPGGAFSCPGVTAVVSGQVTTYTIPLNVALIDSSGGLVSSSYTLVVNHNVQTGSVTFNPTSRYPVYYHVQSAHVEHGSCAADGTGANGVYWGQAVFQIAGTFIHTPAGKIIGPRNASDIYIPDSPFAHTLDGPPTTTCDSSTSKCTYTVTLRTECRILDHSGNSFIDNAFMNTSHVGGPYSANQATQHVFNVDIYSCNATAPTVCTKINIAVDGSPDVVVSYVQIQAYPPILMARERYNIYVGLLPFPGQTTPPTDNLMAFVPRPSDAYTPSTPIYYKNNTRNQALTFGGVITPMVWIDPGQWNTGAVIRIDPTTITFTPTDTTGNVVGPMKNWTDLHPLTSYLPLATAGSSTSEELKIVQNANGQGVDGFGIPTYSLVSLWSQGGVYFQGIQMSFACSIVQVPAGSSTPSRRRLLQVTTSTTGTTSSATLVHDSSLNVAFTTSSLDATAPPLDPSSSSSSSSMLTVWQIALIAVAGALVLIGLSFCCYRRCRDTKKSKRPFCPCLSYNRPRNV